MYMYTVYIYIYISYMMAIQDDTSNRNNKSNYFASSDPHNLFYSLISAATWTRLIGSSQSDANYLIALRLYNLADNKHNVQRCARRCNRPMHDAPVSLLRQS